MRMDKYPGLTRCPICRKYRPEEVCSKEKCTWTREKQKDEYELQLRMTKYGPFGNLG